ncbi:MAG TPA: outer membrane lipoprotein carrier protein LolA [Gemmatimonadales bacterium]|nr:outer membrane lipoprotein carrier protein LolA [Gemmatimonadales bacterium]
MTGRGTLAAALLAALASPLHAQRADSIVERTSAAYRQLRSLTADFRQTVRNDMLGTFTSRGALAQAGASQLSMRFTDPPGEAIVIDGTSVWIYTPSTAPGQVIRTPIANTAGYGVNLLGWLLDKPAERYTARYLGEESLDGTPVAVVGLTPAVEGLPFTSATLWLARSDALPRRLEVSEPSGNRRTLTLSNLQTNAPLPPDTFTFTPPKGVKVVTP